MAVFVLAVYESRFPREDSVPMDTYKLVNLYYRKHLYVICRLRLYVVLKHCPVQWLFHLSHLIALVLWLIWPRARREITSAFAQYTGGAGRETPQSLAIDHLSYLIFQMSLIPILPYLPDKSFQHLFDCREFHDFISQYKDDGTMIVGTHFFSAALVVVLSEMFYQLGVRGCGSFQFEEDPRLTHFNEAIKKRFHWSYHTPVNVWTEASGLSAAGSMRQSLRRGDRAIFIFGDVRLKKRHDDISYKAGGLTLYANNALDLCLRHSRNVKRVIAVSLFYDRGRFQLLHSEAVPPEEAWERYYGQILPEQLNRATTQWHLWFMATSMLTGASGRHHAQALVPLPANAGNGSTRQEAL
jgi:hypothetical protein